MTVRWHCGPAARVSGDVPPAPPQVPLKVLHVITRLEAGAGGNTLLSALWMDRRRYETWIAGGGDGALWARAEEEHVHTVRLRRLRREIAPVDDALVLLQLIRLLRRERFAVLHAHSAKAGFLGRLAGALCRVPLVVYTLHGRDPWWPSPDGTATKLREVMDRRLGTFLVLERSLRRLTDRFVAVSPTVARDSVLAGIAAPGRVDVAASAVDLESIPCDTPVGLREELGFPAGVPVVGTVGRLEAQKAPLDFVRMAAAVAARHPQTRFVMVGDGDLADAAAALARDLGVDIRFTGYRGDAARVAATFDVFVVSSLYEGVGRAVTEAMASGRPVVATAVDGVVDVVSHGSTGLLAPARAPEALAAGVCWMLEHPEQAGVMGAQARARVRELFSPQRMCGTLDEVYSAAFGMVALADGPASRPSLVDAVASPSAAGAP